MTDYPIVNAIIFAGLGVIVFAAAISILSRMAPVRVWDEARAGNTAVALIAASVILGVAVIVAATMH